MLDSFQEHELVVKGYGWQRPTLVWMDYGLTGHVPPYNHKAT